MWAEVERLLDEAVGVVFPSAQLLIVDGGERVLERAAGGATGDTEFDLASLTKALATSVVTMQLVERGRLGLDDTVREGVTVRHLLEHASGLPAWKRLAPVPEAASRRAGIVEAVRREPLLSPPGATARYSDLGFILLGDAVERAGGARLDALFAREVAQPLGLALGYGPRPAERCAPTEGELRGIVHDENARDLDGVAGHAGLFGTARDVSAVAASLVAAFGGGAVVRQLAAPDAMRQLVAPDTVRQLVAPDTVRQLVAPDTVRRFWSPSDVPGSTWCLGWDRPSATGSAAGTRWPRDGVGHLGFTGCSLWIDPRRARWVVLLTNRVHPTRANERIRAFRPRLHDAVLAALDGPSTDSAG